MEILNVLTQIQRDLIAVGQRPRSAVMYHLNARPPFAQVNYPDGNQFRIGPDGQTQMHIAGLYVPVQGCPCPEVIWSLNTGVFAWKHRTRIPLALAILAGLAALQFWLSLVPGAPATAWFVDYFAVVMNTALITLAGVCIIAAVLYNFNRGVTVKWGEDDELSGLLQAGQPDITPDILVMSASPDETPAQFVERIREAKYEQLPAGQYLLILTFRTADGLIVRNPDSNLQTVFDRADIKADVPGWVQEVTTPRMFERETWNDYIAYVRAFCIQFADWAKRDKVRQGNPLKNMMDEMNAAATKAAAVLLPLLFAFNLNAQDLQPVGSAQPMPKDAGKGIFSGVPDSAKLEAYKLEMMVNKAKIGRELAPRMAFVMWVFHNWAVPVLFFFGLIALLVAKVSFKEALHDQTGRVIFGHGIAWYGHQARLVVFGVAILIAVVEIADSMITAFFAYESLWYGAFKCVGLAVLWYLFVTWITPNPQVEGGAQAVLRGGAQGNNYPRIG